MRSYSGEPLFLKIDNHFPSGGLGTNVGPGPFVYLLMEHYISIDESGVLMFEELRSKSVPVTV